MADVEQPEPADRGLIALLVRRDGQRTMVELQDGRRLSVCNIAWGYDMSDEYAHVTTNISLSVEGEAADFFFTNEVIAVHDESGRALPRDA